MLSVIAFATFVLLGAVSSCDWEAIDLDHSIILPTHPELDGDIPITSQPDALLPSYQYVFSRTQIEQDFDVITWAELMVQTYSDVMRCVALGHNMVIETPNGEQVPANELSQQHGITQIMSKDGNNPDGGWTPIFVQSCLIESCIRGLGPYSLAQVREHDGDRLSNPANIAYFNAYVCPQCKKTNQDRKLTSGHLDASSRLLDCGATEQVGDCIGNPAKLRLNGYLTDDIIRSGQQSECIIDGCRSAPESNRKGDYASQHLLKFSPESSCVSCTSQQKSWSNSSYDHAHCSNMVDNLSNNNVHIIDWDINSLRSTDELKSSDNPAAELNDHSSLNHEHLPPHLRPIIDNSILLDIGSSDPSQPSSSLPLISERVTCNHASPITISKVDDSLTLDQPVLDSSDPIIIDWDLSSSSSHEAKLSGSLHSEQSNPNSGNAISLDDEYFLPFFLRPVRFGDSYSLDIYRPDQDQSSLSCGQPLIPEEVNCNVAIDDYESSALTLPPSPQQYSLDSIPDLDGLHFSPYENQPKLDELPANMPVLSPQSVMHHHRSVALPESNRFQRSSISTHRPAIQPRPFPFLSSSNTEPARQVYRHRDPLASRTRASYSTIYGQTSVGHSAVDRRSVAPSQGYLRGRLNWPSSDITAQRSYRSNQEMPPAHGMARYAEHPSYVPSQEYQHHSGIYHLRNSRPLSRSHREGEPLRHSQWRQHPKAIAMFENWRTDARSTLLSTYPRHSQDDQESVPLSQNGDRRNVPESAYETPGNELRSSGLDHRMYYDTDRDDWQPPPKIVVVIHNSAGPRLAPNPGRISDISVPSDLSIRRQRSRVVNVPSLPSSNNPRAFISSDASGQLVKPQSKPGGLFSKRTNSHQSSYNSGSSQSSILRSLASCL